MTISSYTVRQLVPYIIGDNYPPRRTGPDLVRLFNQFGFRDLYDSHSGGGLPFLDKRMYRRPSRTDYTEMRLNELLGKHELRELLSFVINQLHEREESIVALNKILNPEKFAIVKNGDTFLVQGGVIDKTTPVVNEAHFQDIQNRIHRSLDEAQVSIWVLMAWFTNEVLFQKLIEKLNEGIDVQLALFDDGINKKHGVNISQLPHHRLKRGQRGGLMHNKFCVIDNQVIITGSYNWTNNAETRNDENVTVERDPKQATQYSREFRRLIQDK